MEAGPMYTGDFQPDYFHSEVLNGSDATPSVWLTPMQMQMHQQQMQLPDGVYRDPNGSQNSKKRKVSAGVNGEVPGFLHDYNNDDNEGDFEEDTFDPNGMGPDQVGRAPRRVCDMINILACRENSLKFDSSQELFTVLDGELFQKEFITLKASKGKKSDAAADRVFAQMYRTYQIVHGERWGATGTVFKAKKLDTPLPTPTGKNIGSPSDQTPSVGSPTTGAPPQFDVSRSTSVSTPVQHSTSVGGDSVTIWLTDPDGHKMQCTLQHFLDITGAGQLYSTAMQADKRPRQDTGPGPMWVEEARRSGPLSAADIAEVVGGVWNASSKGDQAYFFRRKAGVVRFTNGSIVGVVAGELTECGEVVRRGGLYMVVSDDNAKWKGEPIPSSEEEPLGHWCCFLGQVPVSVAGKVKCGDHIGPRADGVAVVTTLGSGPVVGTALQDKELEAPGIVKVLCFAGLNAVRSGSEEQLKPLLEKAVALEQRVDKLDRDVTALDHRIVMIEGASAGTTGRVEALERELGTMGKVFHMFRRDDDGHLTRNHIYLMVTMTLLVLLVVVVTVFVTRGGDSSGPPPHFPPPHQGSPSPRCLDGGYDPPPDGSSPCQEYAPGYDPDVWGKPPPHHPPHRPWPPPDHPFWNS